MYKIVFGLILIILIAVGFYFGREYLPYLTSDNGKISINSNPKTTVFINGTKEGETPFGKLVKPGDYEIRLLPENESETASWQQRIKVNEGVESHITVNLGPTESTSSWHSIILEKVKKGPSEISIFSNADASEIYIDGVRKGTTPLTLPNIAPGNHELRLLASNYAENSFKFKATDNFKVQITNQLAETNASATQSAVSSTNPQNQLSSNKDVKVKILSTPTGWLRVRSEPTKESEELVKVKPDEEFPYIEEVESWFKIEYETGKTGWISSEYAEKVE